MSIVINCALGEIHAHTGRRHAPGAIVLACHEAGHVVAGLALGRRAERVWIDGQRGAVDWADAATLDARSRRGARDAWAAAVLLAATLGGGAAAEALLAPDIGRCNRLVGWSSKDAEDLGSVLAGFGLTAAAGQAAIDAGVALARRVVGAHQHDVDWLAWHLLRDYVVDADGIAACNLLAAKYRTGIPDPPPALTVLTEGEEDEGEDDEDALSAMRSRGPARVPPPSPGFLRQDGPRGPVPGAHGRGADTITGTVIPSVPWETMDALPGRRSAAGPDAR